MTQKKFPINFVNKGLEGSTFLQNLVEFIGIETIRFSTTLQPSLLLEGGGHSGNVAIYISFLKFEDEKLLEDELNKMKSIQKSFKITITIIFTESNWIWYECNKRLKGGLMRLIRSNDMKSTITIIKSIYNELCIEKSKKKLEKQHSFFEMEKKKLTGELEASRVFKTLFKVLV